MGQPYVKVQTLIGASSSLYTADYTRLCEELLCPIEAQFVRSMQGWKWVNEPTKAGFSRWGWVSQVVGARLGLKVYLLPAVSAKSLASVH